MFCTKCGQENTNNSNFCIRCGNPLEKHFQQDPQNNQFANSQNLNPVNTKDENLNVSKQEEQNTQETKTLENTPDLNTNLNSKSKFSFPWGILAITLGSITIISGILYVILPLPKNLTAFFLNFLTIIIPLSTIFAILALVFEKKISAKLLNMYMVLICIMFMEAIIIVYTILQ